MRSRRPELLLVAATLALAIGFCAYAYSQRWYNDDAFITFRYSEHLAEGHGFVWNVGGPPIEGTTSLGWCLLNAGAIVAGWTPIRFSHAAGLISAAFALFVLLWAARSSLRTTATASLLAVALLATSRQWIVWSVGAMETRTATALAFTATAVFAWELQRSRWPWISGLAFFTATVFRPETPLLHAAAGLGAVLMARNARTFARVAVSGLVHGIGLGALVAWRLAYFGQPLPNTFYAKVGGAQFDDGLLYVGQFLLQTHALVWLPLAAVGAYVAWRSGLFLGAMLATQLVLHSSWIAYSGGGRWEFRYFDAVIPAICLLVACAVSFVGSRTGLARVGAAVGLGAVALAAQVATTITPFATFSEVYPVHVLKSSANAQLQHGTILARYLQPSDRICTGWAGAFPYRTKTWHFDPWGLNDAEIARRDFNPDSPLFHQRHADWADVEKHGVMFCDLFNQFVFAKPITQAELGRAKVVPWVRAGVPVHCLRLPRGGYWIFASPESRETIQRWASERGLVWVYSTTLPDTVEPLFAGTVIE